MLHLWLILQVLLTAVNRKGLCVEEENIEDRRKQQIVVGLLVACTLRMLQRGPDVNACGEIVELSAMVGSPFPCSEFIVSKKYQGIGRGSSGVWTGHGYQRQLPEGQQQQEAPFNSKSMKQSGLASLFHATDTHPLDRQQTILQDEGSIVLSNFPDVLEGYGGALLLPNLQQRSDCLISVTSSTATVSGRPHGILQYPWPTCGKCLAQCSTYYLYLRISAYGEPFLLFDADCRIMRVKCNHAIKCFLTYMSDALACLIYRGSYHTHTQALRSLRFINITCSAPRPTHKLPKQKARKMTLSRFMARV